MVAVGEWIRKGAERQGAERACRSTGCDPDEVAQSVRCLCEFVPADLYFSKSGPSLTPLAAFFCRLLGFGHFWPFRKISISLSAARLR